jgi:hypothetical protein
MKTKEYTNKYKLNEIGGVYKFNHNDFIADLTIDFMTLLEIGNSTKNIKGFENAVRAIRMKWDAINNKTVGQLPDKLWNYFYAKVIMGYKQDLFPEILKARAEAKVEAKKRREEYRRFIELENGDYFSFGFNDLFSSFIASLFKAQIPEESFAKLGLTTSATMDEVKESYRTLALQYHPDKGGNNDLFIAITEAKNKCLMYLKNKL